MAYVDREIKRGWLLNFPNIGCLYLNMKNNGMNIATKFRARDF